MSDHCPPSQDPFSLSFIVGTSGQRAEFWLPDTAQVVYDLLVTSLESGATGVLTEVHASNNGVGWAYVDTFGPDGLGDAAHAVQGKGIYWRLLIRATPSGTASVTVVTDSRPAALPRYPLFIPEAPEPLAPRLPERWLRLDPTLLDHLILA